MYAEIRYIPRLLFRKLESVPIIFSKTHFELVLQIGPRTSSRITCKSNLVKTTSGMELVLVLQYMQISVSRFGLEFGKSVVGSFYEVLKEVMTMALTDIKEKTYEDLLTDCSTDGSCFDLRCRSSSLRFLTFSLSS